MFPVWLASLFGKGAAAGAASGAAGGVAKAAPAMMNLGGAVGGGGGGMDLFGGGGGASGAGFKTPGVDLVSKIPGNPESAGKEGSTWWDRMQEELRREGQGAPGTQMQQVQLPHLQDNLFQLAQMAMQQRQTPRKEKPQFMIHPALKSLFGG